MGFAMLIPGSSMSPTVRFQSRQLALPFDVPLWTPSGLEAALAREAKRPVCLTVTENRSVLLSFRKDEASVLVRLHRMFLHAPITVVRAVARGLARRSRKADGAVRRFMNENLHRVQKVKRPLPPLVTAGRVHDLTRIFERLNRRFFRAGLEVPMTWGRGSGRARRGGLTFGSYDPVLGLIRIHPVLDRSDVPLYFLESVVYHEMLPPPWRRARQRRAHGVSLEGLPRRRGALPRAPQRSRLGEGEPAPSPPGEP